MWECMISETRKGTGWHVLSGCLSARWNVLTQCDPPRATHRETSESWGWSHWCHGCHGCPAQSFAEKTRPGLCSGFASFASKAPGNPGRRHPESQVLGSGGSLSRSEKKSDWYFLGRFEHGKISWNQDRTSQLEKIRAAARFQVNLVNLLDRFNSVRTLFVRFCRTLRACRNRAGTMRQHSPRTREPGRQFR